MSLVSNNPTCRALRYIVVVLLISMLIISCSTGETREAEDVPGGGDRDQARLGSDDSSEQDSSADDALDELDLTQYFDCPDKPREFVMEPSFLLQGEEEDGYYIEKTTKDDLGFSPRVHFYISKQGVDFDDDIPAHVQIEGESGDCTISGWADISFNIQGTCKGEKAILDIQGEYEFWTQTIECPGEAPVTGTDSLFPAPSINAEFYLTEKGDTVKEGFEQGPVKLDYRWTLRALPSN